MKYGDYVFYSSSALFKPKEGMVGHYRKNDLWMAVDKASMTAGNKLVTYDTEYGRISIAVCFDVMALLPLIKKHNVWAHFHSFAWVDESIYTPEGIILSQDSSPLGNGFTLAELDPPEEIIPPPYPLYE